MEYAEIRQKKKNKASLLTVVPLALVAVFFTFQLFVLSNVGDKCQKITALKAEQSELKIDNEIYKAKIMELQTTNAVVTPLTEAIKVEKKSVNVIDLSSNNNVSAMK
jgi:hypothetical protein